MLQTEELALPAVEEETETPRSWRTCLQSRSSAKARTGPLEPSPRLKLRTL